MPIYITYAEIMLFFMGMGLAGVVCGTEIAVLKGKKAGIAL